MVVCFSRIILGLIFLKKIFAHVKCAALFQKNIRPVTVTVTDPFPQETSQLSSQIRIPDQNISSICPRAFFINLSVTLPVLQLKVILRIASRLLEMNELL
jgi:hypothetical protein